MDCLLRLTEEVGTKMAVRAMCTGSGFENGYGDSGERPGDKELAWRVGRIVLSLTRLTLCQLGTARSSERSRTSTIYKFGQCELEKCVEWKWHCESRVNEKILGPGKVGMRETLTARVAESLRPCPVLVGEPCLSHFCRVCYS